MFALSFRISTAVVLLFFGVSGCAGTSTQAGLTSNEGPRVKDSALN